jgi:transposase
MEVTTIGIDLSKNVFQIHGVDQRGKTALKKQLKRVQMLPYFANVPSCLIGIEACGSAHYWARKLNALGHTVRLSPGGHRRFKSSHALTKRSLNMTRLLIHSICKQLCD